MMAGTLAITGVGIRCGCWFGFAGFYSKDAIIEAAFARGTDAGGIAFAVGVFAALADQLLLVAADVPDLLRQAALGGVRAYPACGPRCRPSRSRRPTRMRGHEHRTPTIRSPTCRTRHRRLSSARKPVDDAGPAGVLSIGAMFAGFVFHDAFIDAENGAHFWQGSIAFDEHLMHAMHEVPLWVKLLAGDRDADRLR